MDIIRMIHVADIHLGFTGNTSLVFKGDEPQPGRYVREVDIEQAVKWFTKLVCNAQLPVDLVVIAGDLFHRSVPLPRTINLAAEFVSRLLAKGVEVVIIDGNHELASAIDTGSPTTFLRTLGAHVINEGRCKVIHDNDWQFNKRLRGKLAVHALPYRAILAEAFAGISPLVGYENVLLTHGRIETMDGLNSLHRSSAPIPSRLLDQDWQYIALGDWHIHQYQPLSGMPAFYAGGLEALTFGEAASYPARTDDHYARRGLLDVRLETGKPAEIFSIEYSDRRPVLRLTPIDASDLTSEALLDIIRERLDDRLPSEALVRLDIQKCPVSVREQLDFVALESLRQRVRFCDIRWEIVRATLTQSNIAPNDATIVDQWQEFLVQQMIDEESRTWFAESGTKRINDAKTTLQKQQAQVGG